MTVKLTKLHRFKSIFLAFSFCLFLFVAAIPSYVGPGLDDPEPVGAYFNGMFSATSPDNSYYEVAFPRITFDSPLTFEIAPAQNKIIVGQRDGKIYTFEDTPDPAQKDLMIDLSAIVGVVWDGGLLGSVLHPEFGSGGENYLYVFYTTRDRNGANFPDQYMDGQGCGNNANYGNHIILERYTVNPGTMVADPASRSMMIKVRMYGASHRGGALQFGQDGFLYVTTGDQTDWSKSQDIINNLDGGVLRLDVDEDATKSHVPTRVMPGDWGFSDEITGQGYYIPNDNPFVSPQGANFEEYYSFGHRAPHRMSMDKETGIIYIGETGLAAHEEVNVLQKGGNFGWPVYEGFARQNFCGNQLYNNMPHTEPLTAFQRSDANSLTGGFVYRGSSIPELYGKYICADYGTGEEIFAVDIETGAYEEIDAFEPTNIISFGQDVRGELYLLKLGDNSNLYRLKAPQISVGNLPGKLSDIGVFTDLQDLSPAQGVIPYELIESFWSDGALKRRWMIIPNDGTHDTPGEQIQYSENGVWTFPAGAVLVKHFDMQMDENDPASIRKVETRFIVKTVNGFYFATYRWNEAQTDATLVDISDGDDRELRILTASGGVRNQLWRYPSHSECLTCHNQTSQGMLGARTRYLNHELVYPKTGVSSNQLVTLSHLGILNQNISEEDTQNLLTFVAKDDQNATLEDRARSYLDLNCSYCHRPGTGNRAGFDLRLINSLPQTGLLSANPGTPLGLPDEKIINPGNAESSILYARIHSLDQSIMMPPLAKEVVDEAGAALIRDWINELQVEVAEEGVYTIESAASGKVLDVENASLADGANIQQWVLNNQDNQKFVIEAGKPGYFRVKAVHSDKYVDVAGSGQAPGTNVWQYVGNGTDAQEWQIVSDGTGYFNFISKANGLYLDVDGASVLNGANIKVWTPNGTDAQRFKLNPVEITTSAPGLEPVNYLRNLVLYPNPVTRSSDIQVKYPSRSNGRIVLRIVNAQGREMSSKEYQVTPGINTLKVPVGQLTSAVYQVIISDGRNNVVRSVMIH